ncbi:Zn-dependent hydrolase [Ornithinimicrobium sp. W1665]|uniref:Zn-dependent hydrolase n=1 Tax=Ornithinimicrobium sp. W1665 TaxID=3416666 RepID=UPI003D6BD03E
MADPARITELIASIAAINDTPADQGITRIGFTPSEKRAHKQFSDWLCDIGLTVRSDEVGNTIAEKVGLQSLPAIGTGSHLDSVPGGGRFDGIAGVVAAVHVAELLVRHEIPHRHPLRFVAFVCEEGARFGQACVGSKAAGGHWSYEALQGIRDSNGISIADAIQRSGGCPSDVVRAIWQKSDWAAFLELHVEQGGQLEESGVDIGLVDLISGSTRFELVLEGVASHTGSTPMHLRADALTAAAQVILLAEGIANDGRHRGTRVTVGKVDVHPGSITTIPGRVSLWVDVRDIDSGRQRLIADEIVRQARAVCDARRVALTPRLLSDASPVVLPAWLRDVTTTAADQRGRSYRVMYSGASHDSQMVAAVAPAAMIFVPSRGGLSHVPEEWTSANEIARGVEVLLDSIMALDKLGESGDCSV